MKFSFAILATLIISSCAVKDKFDVAAYYSPAAQDSLKTSIITYLLPPPPYVSAANRFNIENRAFYVEQAAKYSLDKLFIDQNGLCSFFVIRPGAEMGTNRGVGGQCRINNGFHLSQFREIFVTPELPVAVATTRGAFLYGEMVKDSLQKYLKMDMYVQWPNSLSYYDTISYSWKWKSEDFK